MTAKHTPGPWYDMPEDSMIPLKAICCERLGFTIGFVNTDRKSVEEQAQANAHLISAAPDLLEALKMAAWAMRAPIDEWKGEVEAGALRAANAAIARATGEL